MVKNLNVALDNMPPGGYPPGATISGRVIVSANERIHIRSLSLKVQGEAEVSFTDMVRRRRRRFRRFRRGNDLSATEIDVEERTSTEVERFTSHEHYFSTSYQILGETDIPAGDQEFLFTTVLPAVLPSSFSGRHGFIRYTLKVKLDKAWNFDQIAKVEFRVAAPKNLNLLQFTAVGDYTIQNLADPVVYRGYKHFNCLCCKSGPLSLTVRLSKSGLVPGESVQLTIDIDNSTRVNIQSINIILRQETIWFARNPRNNTKKTNEALLVVRNDGVSPRNNKSWYQTLIIPPLPYINIDACSIIKLQHLIIVEAVPEGIHTNLTVMAPIVIGTEALNGARVNEASFNPPYPTQPGFIPSNVGYINPTAPVDFDMSPPPPYPTPSQPYPPEDPPKKY